VRRIVFVALQLCAVMVRADCSAGYVPSQYSVQLSAPACNASAPCMEKTPVYFSVGPRTGACYVPFYGPCRPVPYAIDACDTLTWDFGDGTPPEIVRGSGNVDHVFSRPGSYAINVSIQNAVGSGSLYGSAYICAGPPTFLRFTQKLYETTEDAGSVAVTLERSGDVSRAFTVDYSTLPGSRKLEPMSTNLFFAVGETVKTIVHRVQDDAIFGGDADDVVGIRSDGAVVTGSGMVAIAKVRVLEDEPGPRLTIDDVTMAEGNGEQVIDFPLHLSMPATDRVYVGCTLVEGTAHAGVDFRPVNYTVVFEPGQTSAACRVRILGNSFAEGDKTFTVVTEPLIGPVSVKKRAALCTLLNDDVDAVRRRSVR
jgi:PKD repeat protein